MSDKLTQTESVYNEKTPKKEVDTPLADGFKKVKRITGVTTSVDLLRKRRRVKRKS